MSAHTAPPATQQQPTSDQVVIAALSVVLAAQLSHSTTAALALPLLAELGIPPAAGVKALALLVPNVSPAGPGHIGQQSPLAPGAEIGPALRQVTLAEPALRAAYLTNSARRYHAAGATPAQERAYLSQHLAASHARAAAAVQVDRAARIHGPELGWHAMLDSATTPECRAAHGSNFNAATPPAIGYPGTLHGGTCRCQPGAPFHEGLPTDEAVTEGLKRLTGSHDVAFSRDGDELVIDLVFDPGEPRDNRGRWRRLREWLAAADRSKLRRDGNPGEGQRPPTDPRAEHPAPRVVGYPTLADAIEAQRVGAEFAGQDPQPLERRDALESALARPQHHVAYGGDLADAAAATAHGVSQSQAFRDGNKRAALVLVDAFLGANGHDLTAAQVRDLERHIQGYGEGTHTLSDTAAWLRSVLSRPHPGG